MEAYNEAIPNGADRLLRMAETQEAHRQFLERTKIEADAYSEKRGLTYGLSVALAGICVGGALIGFGHDTAGAVLAGTPLVSKVGIFVYGRQAQQRQLAARQAVLQQAMAKSKGEQGANRRRKGKR
jgi:uncharacterized membrane protein